MLSNVSINWKAETPTVLSFEHYDEAMGWTIIPVKFKRTLKSERTRNRRSDELFYAYEAEGLDGVRRYAGAKCGG